MMDDPHTRLVKHRQRLAELLAVEKRDPAALGSIEYHTDCVRFLEEEMQRNGAQKWELDQKMAKK